MEYSFFGTCANDSFHTKNVIKNILSQTISPKEIILVDSGDINQYKELKNYFGNSDIKFIYLFKKLSRVKALNFAIDNISSDFCMRFDTRSRFASNYAEEALKILQDKKREVFFVGGVPEVVPEDSSRNAKISSEIFGRPYVFFYPRHRKIGYEGFSSSIYLGCFNTKILNDIKYREDVNLISEDSLLSADYSERNYKLWISSSIKLKYISRAKLLNILRLFNTYGFCRLNTIITSGKIHSKKRYIRLLIILIGYFFITFKLFPSSILFFPIIIFLVNSFGELTCKKNSKSLIYPLLACFCQLSWLVGFIWAVLVSFKIKKLNSNFIK